jgi:Mrp family chromosome partitioning ATPase
MKGRPLEIAWEACDYQAEQQAEVDRGLADLKEMGRQSEILQGMLGEKAALEFLSDAKWGEWRNW